MTYKDCDERVLTCAKPPSTRIPDQITMNVLPQIATALWVIARELVRFNDGQNDLET
jgi:hypothetical protein